MSGETHRGRLRLSIIALSLGIAILTMIPYAAAGMNSGGFRFTGFLFNPYDAASYLAKMRQAEEGRLLYTLAFTENPGPGAQIVPYYFLLGHLARLFGLPLVFLWHIARVLGAAFFLTVAWVFFGRIGLSRRGRIIAWILAALGSGFGFAAVAFGVKTADLWVAEFIPLLGMLTSAHFPLATGLILLLAMQIALPARRQSPISLAAICLLGVLLGAVQPFGILPLGFALVMWMGWTRITKGAFPEGSISGLLAAGLGLLPWAAYYLWVVRSLPAFASWFAQNQTPTPPLWDLVLALGLPGLIAAVSFVRWIAAPAPIREKARSVSAETLLPGLWLAVNLVLLFAPFSLQRRLMLGMWIPLTTLAAPVIESWLFRPAFSLLRTFAVSIPLFLTGAVSLMILMAASRAHGSILFLDRDAAAVTDWLEANAQGTVVLAPPDSSLWLPGMAGVRVVYGHPMETPHADQARADVENFFLPVDAAAQLQILIDRRVDWVICDAEGPACNALEGGVLQEVFASGRIRLMAVHIK
jgi:hypothetical protein